MPNFSFEHFWPLTLVLVPVPNTINTVSVKSHSKLWCCSILKWHRKIAMSHLSGTTEQPHGQKWISLEELVKCPLENNWEMWKSEKYWMPFSMLSSYIMSERLSLKDMEKKKGKFKRKVFQGMCWVIQNLMTLNTELERPKNCIVFIYLFTYSIEERCQYKLLAPNWEELRTGIIFFLGASTHMSACRFPSLVIQHRDVNWLQSAAFELWNFPLALSETSVSS